MLLPNQTGTRQTLEKSADPWHQSFPILHLCWLSKLTPNPNTEARRSPPHFHQAIQEWMKMVRPSLISQSTQNLKPYAPLKQRGWVSGVGALAIMQFCFLGVSREDTEAWTNCPFLFPSHPQSSTTGAEGEIKNLFWIHTSQDWALTAASRLLLWQIFAH